MFSRPRSHPLSRTVTAVAVVAVCLCSCTASPAYPPYKLPALSIQASFPHLRPPPPPPPSAGPPVCLPVRPFLSRPPTSIHPPPSIHSSLPASLPASLRPSVCPFVWGLGRTVAFAAGGQSAADSESRGRRVSRAHRRPRPGLAGSREVAGPAPRALRPRAKSATRAPRP